MNYMKIQRLPWAGLMVETDAVTLLIDPITSISPSKELFGQPKETILPLAASPNVTRILQTHLHSDHFDPQAIIDSFGEEVTVYVPDESVSEAKKHKLNHVIGAKIDEQFSFENFEFFAVNALCGFGSPQVSWVIKSSGLKLFHGGDTLWHGYWWKIAKTHGPLDVVFLPVNAALIRIPGEQPSKQAICLSPEQAVSAAELLGAKVLVPIHYNTFHNPPSYIQTPDISERLLKAAKNVDVEIKFLEPYESFEL
jgi:L-ascorbate metabolism protein UlaG (beta-lactamase superfamily)